MPSVDIDKVKPDLSLNHKFEAFCETVQMYFMCNASKEHFEKAFVFFTAATGRGLPVTDEDLQWAKDELSNQGKIDAGQYAKCRKCGGEMKPGHAIEQTCSGIPDFPGG